jgi:hypothetical protein
MRSVFLFCFWIFIFIVTLIAFIYSIESQNNLDNATFTINGRIESQVRETSLLTSRDLLTTIYVLTGIALILQFAIFVIVGMYGFCSFYGMPFGVWLVYIFFVVWFAIIFSMVAYVSHEIGVNPSTLDDRRLLTAERDLGLVMICDLTVIILFIIGFFTYAYVVDECASYRQICE